MFFASSGFQQQLAKLGQIFQFRYKNAVLKWGIWVDFLSARHAGLNVLCWKVFIFRLKCSCLPTCIAECSEEAQRSFIFRLEFARTVCTSWGCFCGHESTCLSPMCWSSLSLQGSWYESEILPLTSYRFAFLVSLWCRWGLLP